MPSPKKTFPLSDEDVLWPDSSLIDQQIHLIVDKGLPGKPRLWSMLGRMYREVGLRHIFRDGPEIAVVSILTLVLAGLAASLQTEVLSASAVQMAYVLLFILAPMGYLLLASLTWMTKKVRGTFETENLCKYNVYQIAAFRLFWFSGMALLLSAVNIGLLQAVAQPGQPLNLLRAWLLSLTSLFVFSALFLFLLTRLKPEWAVLLLGAGWIFINAVLLKLSASMYAALLQQLPLYAYILVLIAGIYGTLHGLQSLLTFRMPEGGYQLADRSRRI